MKLSGLIVTAALFALVTGGIVGIKAMDTAGKSEVSPALNILARDLCTVKSGLCGNDVRFCAADLTETLGVEKLGRTVITSLPDAAAGKLMLGSLEVMKNQTVSEENLSALRFVPSDSAERDCFFTVITGAERRYEVKCTIRMISEINRPPTAPSEKQKVESYRDIAVFGKMTAVDLENDALTYEIVSSARNGLFVTTSKSGEYIYTPIKGFTGKDSFSYRAIDAYGNRSEIITVGITVSRSAHGTIFDDMLGAPAHYAAITVSDLGIMNGGQISGSTLFDPNGGVERAEFLTAAMKAVGYDAPEIGQGTISAFADDDDILSEYRPYVIAAYNRGMISGDDSSGKLIFEPCGYITVSDALIMLDGILNPETRSETQVSESAAAVNDRLSEAVSRLVKIGVIDSVTEPGVELTRADAAVLLCRIIAYVKT